MNSLTQRDYLFKMVSTEKGKVSLFAFPCLVNEHQWALGFRNLTAVNMHVVMFVNIMHK